MLDGSEESPAAASINMSETKPESASSPQPKYEMGGNVGAKSNTVFYILAIVLGTLAGIAHITIEDPLITALIVLASAMFLGFMRPTRPWRWTLLVGLMVPVVMIVAHLAGRYANFTRAGIYGSVLLILPGIAGAYGGFFGRRFISEVFFAKGEKK
jgi:hypothetical protein